MVGLNLKSINSLINKEDDDGIIIKYGVGQTITKQSQINICNFLSKLVTLVFLLNAFFKTNTIFYQALFCILIGFIHQAEYELDLFVNHMYKRFREKKHW